MGQRILVVDDEEQMRQLLSLYLSKQGYRVSTAASSAEALQQIAQTPFHLVVVDIGLANEDGLHLLAYLKAEHPKLRVVMLTGGGGVLAEENYAEEETRHSTVRGGG